MSNALLFAQTKNASGALTLLVPSYTTDARLSEMLSGVFCA